MKKVFFILAFLMAATGFGQVGHDRRVVVPSTNIRN